MPKNLTFNELCKIIKKEESDIIEVVDSFIGAAIIFTPIILGPAALPFLGLLEVKNELTEISKKILNKITSKKEENYLGRIHRMEMAYGLICFTAFFDALDQNLPDNFRKAIAITYKEKVKILSSTDCDIESPVKNVDFNILKLNGPYDVELPLQHPVRTFNETKKQLSGLYDQMAKGVGQFVEKLSIYENSDEITLSNFSTIIKKLPQNALKSFEEQYYELSVKYNEFWIWLQIKEGEAVYNQNSEYLTKYSSLIKNTENLIDIGFSNLQKTVLTIPNIFKEIEAKQIVEGLKHYYDSRIEEAVIDDKEISEVDKPTLSFPKISEAFVPQSYRVLQYLSKDMHLERESTWKRLNINNDLEAFFVKYLSSPYSIETPLLILGHPGSGKSLLTKVLSARLMCEAYTPIRIPLREVNAELGFEVLVERQIEKDTGNRIKSWADFSSQFTERPLLIILDGYDELLQASGKVFSGYLDRVQKFQQDQIVQKRPVRVIITSRITLIDKAAIPIGATILRLLEFNEVQRDTWISIWNQANIRYFSDCEPIVKPFKIPNGKGIKKDKILELAEQPLLLLMLAIYDSDGNSLHKSNQLNRTALYDSLLRRFVQRERRRYVENFDYLPIDERNKEIDKEMKRLGAVAIGMYNRCKMHIFSSELNSDIKFLGLERKIEIQNDRPVSEADLLLGSFFFIHKSSSGDTSDEKSNIDTSFEFLHNTFGEFLTADFILSFALQETEAIYTFKKSHNLLTELQRKTQDPNGIAKEWFACLMFAPLYSRPVIPEMLREWATYRLEKMEFNQKDFLECLDIILKSHVKMALESRDFPEIMKTDKATQFADIPFLGFLATYTLNLFVLRTVLDSGEFIFNEEEYCSKTDRSEIYGANIRPWDKLTQIWKSWFKLENLSGLSAIIYVKRDNKNIILKARKEFQSRPDGNQLETLISVAEALADNITIGLASIHSTQNKNGELDKLEKQLSAEKIDLSFEFLVRRLRNSIANKGVPSYECDEIVFKCMDEVISKNQTENLLISFIDLLEKAFRFKYLSIGCENRVLREFMDFRNFEDTMNKCPELSIGILRIVRESKNSHWIERNGQEFFDHIMHQRRIDDLMEKYPELAIEFLRLMKEFKWSKWIERYEDEFFGNMMHSRRLNDMMGMHPELTIEILRLAREFKGSQWIEEYVEEFFRSIIYPTSIKGMMELRPELSIVSLCILQEFNGNQWIQRNSEYIFEHIIQFGHLEDIMEMHPDLAIKFLRIIQGFKEDTWIKINVEEFFNRIVSRRLVDIMEMRPELAIEFISIMKEFKGSQWIEQNLEEFFEHIVSRRFEGMIEMHPELAIEFLYLVQQFKGSQRIERNIEEIFERELHSRDMTKISPKRTVEFLRIAREFKGSQWVERFKELIELIMRTNRLEDIMNMSYELGTEFLRITREYKGGVWLESHSEEIFERVMHPNRLIVMIETHPQIAIEWLRHIKGLNGTNWKREFTRQIKDKFTIDDIACKRSKGIEMTLAIIRSLRLCGCDNLLYNRENIQAHRNFDIYKVPFDYIIDMQWYAHTTNDTQLQNKLKNLADEK